MRVLEFDIVLGVNTDKKNTCRNGVLPKKLFLTFFTSKGARFGKLCLYFRNQCI